MESQPVRMPSPLARTGCLISTLAAFALVVLLMFVAVFVGIPIGTMAGKLQADLGERGEITKMDMPDGRTWQFTIRLEPAYESQALEILCNVVKPDLAGTAFASAHVELTNREGRILATDQTSCGG